MIFSQQYFECALLALALWREARGQYHDIDILRAIAWSIRNRVTRGSKDDGTFWGKSWSGVLGFKFQYSSLTAPGDANLVKWPLPDDPSWLVCMDVACEVYNGGMVDVSGGATHYFSQDNPPIWAVKLRHIKDMGPFKFYEQI